MTSGLIALSSHVEVTGERAWHDVLLETSATLPDRFGTFHVTLQPEEPDHLPGALRGSSLDLPEGRAACQVGVQPSMPERHSHTDHPHSWALQGLYTLTGERRAAGQAATDESVYGQATLRYLNIRNGSLEIPVA